MAQNGSITQLQIFFTTSPSSDDLGLAEEAATEKKSRTRGTNTSHLSTSDLLDVSLRIPSAESACNGLPR